MYLNEAPSDAQGVAADNLLDDLLWFCRSSSFGQQELGGGRKRLFECIESLSHANPLNDSFSSAQCLGPALPAKLERIAIPAGGICNPADHLNPWQREIFEGYDRRVRLALSEWPEVTGDPCHLVNPSEELELARRLLRNGMAVLIPQESVARGRDGRLIRSGFFVVEHEADRDRLIKGRRIPNLTERPLGWVSLPHGVLLRGIILRPEETLRASGDDLRAYFYSVKQAPGEEVYNAARRPLHGYDLTDFGGIPGKKYFTALVVTGMGGRNSFDICHATHESVLRRTGGMNEAHRLDYNLPVPKSRTWQAAYADDHFVIQRLPRDKLKETDGWKDRELVTASELGYAQAGVELAPGKSYRYQEDFCALGTDVRPRRGWAGSPLKKRHQVAVLASRLVQLGRADKHVMQSFLGGFGHPFLHRPELNSVWHRVYKWVDGLHDTGVRKIPPDICDELIVGTLFLAFAHAPLRWNLDGRLRTTDATPTAFGATEVTIPDAIGRELHLV